MKKIILLTIITLPLFSFSADLRIGWQIPWSVQGQIVAVLKNTDALKKQGLTAKFVGKTFGPELNELALANEIDVVLTADQPAATLFSKDKGWVGIARLMYNRTATYVPVNSDIKTIKDLKTKKVGVPFGAAAQRVTYEAVKQESLDPAKDLQFSNLGILEQDALIRKNAKDTKKWDQFDALSGFDPLPARLETEGLIKVIHEGKVVALVLMNEAYIQKNPEVPKKLILALQEAYQFYQKNTAKANQWYIEDSKLAGMNDKVFALTSKFEPNLESGNKIRLSFNDSDFEIMDQASQFIEKNVGKKVDMKKYVSNKFVDAINESKAGKK